MLVLQNEVIGYVESALRTLDFSDSPYRERVGGWCRKSRPRLRISLEGSHLGRYTSLVTGANGDRKDVMIRVRARSNESVQQLIRRFTKICEKEGLNRDIKRNSYYEKPSQRRRRKERKSRKRALAAMRS